MPGLAICGVFWAIGRLIVDEKDEFIRMLIVRQTLIATGVEGRIGTVGALSGSPADPGNFGQGPILGKNITIKGITSGHRGMFEDCLKVMAQHGVETLVDETFFFALR